MIKVFYSGYMIKQNSSQPEYENNYFQLSDDDVKRFESIGKVTVRSVIGERLDEYDMLIWEEGDALPLVQYSAILTDRIGEPDAFKLSKEKTYDEHENGNILELIFDQEPQINPVPSTPPSTDDLGHKTKLQKQHAAIMEVIKQLGFDPMAIPDGKKPEIEFACMKLDESNKLLFDGSSSFENAWRKGKELFRMANHASFAKRNKQ